MIEFFAFFVAFTTIFILVFIYFGYPLSLWGLSLFFKKKSLKTPFYPSASLIISCYNEEKIIRDKILNSLEINYPIEKIEIIVVSDASDDRTDTIVSEFADRGVRLIRQKERLGKTCGLNLAVSEAKGEIIVFSDANAMYDPDAVKHLVWNFADENVGYVVGQARYVKTNKSASAKSENTYWNYEIFIKKLESSIHSVVGGDGAIYAIRKNLYDRMKSTDINDFVNPLQIILKGFRGIYEPEAYCIEETAGTFKKEFQRKVRIVNRSFSGLLGVKAVLNPFKSGIFSYFIIFHKLMRWLSPVFLIILGICLLVLSMCNIPISIYLSIVFISFLMCAYVGHLFSSWGRTIPFIHYPYYFVAVNIAALAGILQSLTGEVQVTWLTSRGKEKNNNDFKWTKQIHTAAVFLIIWGVFIAGHFLSIPFFAAQIFFWASALILLYTYFGYPLILNIWAKYGAKPTEKGDAIPEVSLLICAYNEEEVIEQKIKNIFEADYPAEKLKIYIASDGSTDKTCEIVRKYTDSRLKLYAYPERSGKIGAINKTVPEIDSEIILFSDANTMFDKSAVSALIRNFYDPSVGAVSANVILNNEEADFGEAESLYYKYERWIQKNESNIFSMIGADGGMYAIRRELFEAPSSNIILDDFVISMNVAQKGYRLVYEKDALAYEENKISHKTEFLRKSRVMAGAVQAVKQNEGIPPFQQRGLFFCFFSHKFLRWTVPVFLIILLPLNMLLAACTGNNAYLFLLIMQILLYFFALLGFFIQNKIKSPMVLVPFYFCLENGALLYGLYKGIFNKQSVKWRKFSRKKTL